MIALANISDIAEMLGVSRQRAHQIVDKPSFPKPFGQTGSGARIWKPGAVTQWMMENR